MFLSLAAACAAVWASLAGQLARGMLRAPGPPPAPKGGGGWTAPLKVPPVACSSLANLCLRSSGYLMGSEVQRAAASARQPSREVLAAGGRVCRCRSCLMAQSKRDGLG